MITHALTFLVSASVTWFFSGILIDSTTRIARRFHRSGFTVAFLILGLLTSVSEISVALNSMIEGVPQVSAGNLAGASLFIFLLIIPFLAIFGNGIDLEHALRKRHVALALFVILLPSLFMVDGDVSRPEGYLMIAGYLALLFYIMTREGVEQAAEQIQETYSDKFKHVFPDILKVVAGGGLIFTASKLLVSEAVYFSDVFGVPASFIGLTILSIGTNVPELVIAVRAVAERRKQVAFGDYIGSAATNTLIFGLLITGYGPFPVAKGEFMVTSTLLASGLLLFFLFSSTGRNLSRREGLAIGALYVAFIVLQFAFVQTTPPGFER